jgi:hypothetical protein
MTGAGENVRADLLPFSMTAMEASFWSWAKTIGGRETRRAGADDQDVDFQGCRVRA